MGCSQLPPAPEDFLCPTRATREVTSLWKGRQGQRLSGTGWNTLRAAIHTPELFVASGWGCQNHVLAGLFSLPYSIFLLDKGPRFRLCFSGSQPKLEVNWATAKRCIVLFVWFSIQDSALLIMAAGVYSSTCMVLFICQLSPKIVPLGARVIVSPHFHNEKNKTQIGYQLE